MNSNIYSLLRMNLKNVFSIKNFSFLFIYAFSISFLCIVLFPLWTFINIIIIMLTIITGGICFNLSYGIKNSTVYVAYKKNAKDIIGFYFQTLIIMLILTYIIFFVLWIILSIYNAAGIILVHWPWESTLTDVHYQIWNPYFLSVVIYQTFIVVLLLFSLSFALRNVLKNSKSYMIFIMSMVLFCIPFAGTLNNSFGLNTMGDGVEISTYYLPTFKGHSGIYGASLLFPFYGPGQIMSTSMAYSLSQETLLYGNVWHWSMASDSLLINVNPEGYIPPKIKWNILYILPWIEIILFCVLGLFLREKNVVK